VPFNFFYTSNLAFSRNLYERLGGFNEAFIQYGWEDIELGYRYQQKGKMCLKYIPEAIGYHLHDLTVSSFCKRQFHVGYSAVLFYKIYPELSAFLKIKKIHSSIIVMKPLIHLITMLLAYCDEKGINTVPLLNNIMKFHYFLGMRKALSDL
jgi:GT2 family glycosyltransferase